MSRAARLRSVAFAGAVVALATVLAISTWSFVSPTVAREYRLAPASDFAPGTVTSFVHEGDRLTPFTRASPSPAWGWSGTVPPIGDLVHVVRLPDGQLLVLSGVSSHRGQTVLWFPDGTVEVADLRGLFGDDFSWWTVDGARLYGPAPRDLPRYRFTVDDGGVLVVDLSGVVEGDWLPDQRARRGPTNYDVLDAAWASSGWPSAKD